MAVTANSIKKGNVVGRYTKHSHPRAHLTFGDRKRLARDWNEWLGERPRTISISAFAKAHGISRTLWRRELNRCGFGDIRTPNVRRRGRRGRKYDYVEYDAEIAQRDAERLMRNKGPQIKTSAFMARQISKLILEDKMSPYCASMMLKERFKDKHVPSPRTIYNLIDEGLLDAKHGDTPHHPGRRKKPPVVPHQAKTVPGRNKISERPEDANSRKTVGHYEMDTILSAIKGKGGILCLYDRKTRRYCLERIDAISQAEVIRALKRLRKRGLLLDCLSVTTDNGCEFPNQAKLEKTLKCKVYYTRAYASYEKGGIENCNRLCRRWFPKGTNFARVSKQELRRVENIINNMPRKILGGKTPNAYYSFAA